MTAGTPTISGKLRGFWRRLGLIPKSLELFWNATGGRMAWWLLCLIAAGAAPAGIVAATRRVANDLGGLLKSDPPRDFWLLSGPLLGLAIFVLASRALQALAEHLAAVQGEEVQDDLSARIHQKATEVDLAFFEWPEFFDHLHRAQSEARYRPVQLMNNLGALLQAAITLVAMAAILLPYGWWLPLILVVSAVPTFVFTLRQAHAKYLFRQRTTAEERKATYYSHLMTTSEPAAEIRLFGLAGHFQKLWQGIRGTLRRESGERSRRDAWAKVGVSLVGTVIAGGVALWIIRRAVEGTATVGDLVLFYQAFQYGQQLIQTSLNQLGQLYYNTMFLGSLFEFLALEPTVVSPAVPVVHSPGASAEYRFEGVTFSYPQSDRKLLDNFHLELPRGSFTAIVGPNGAGKSTLVKLLCRMYDPVAGRITRDGVDLRSLSLEQLRSGITVLFQRPMPFNATVEQNIAWGDLQASPGRSVVEAAAAAAGAEELIRKLPAGFEQLLGSGFARGTQLSGGEWQRLALARAFVRKAELLILDEPTSAMDPWAELDWMEKFRSIAAGRTVVLITHRFTSARHADVIHVMVDGRIVESGDHKTLVEAGGRYGESWKAQVRDAAR